MVNMDKPKVSPVYSKSQKKVALLFTLLVLLAVFVLYMFTLDALSNIDVQLEDTSACSFQNHAYLVYVEFGEHLCNGAIISPQYVLTSAHCCNYDEYGAVYTYYNRDKKNYDQMQLIRERKVHNLYSQDMKSYDICLVQLAKPLTLNKHTKQVKPLKNPVLTEIIRSGSNVVSVDLIYTGYGISTSDDQDIDDKSQSVEKSKPLQCLRSRILNPNECRSLLGARWEHHFNESNMFCTEAVGLNNQIGPCGGDTGGPVMWGGYTIGVISWGPAGICDTSVIVHARIDVAEDLMTKLHLRSNAIHVASNSFVVSMLSIISCSFFMNMN